MNRINQSPQAHGARSRRTSRANSRGFSLVELMIALMLGLLVVGSASAIFLSNRQTYRATEALGRVQETSRMAYELFSRDVRETGGTPCGPMLQMRFYDMQTVADLSLRDRWMRGVFGYSSATPAPGTPFGVGVGDRKSGTAAIDLLSIDQSTSLTIVQHTPNNGQFRFNTKEHSFTVGDRLVVCNVKNMAVYTVSVAQPGVSDTITVSRTGGPDFGAAADERSSGVLARQSLTRWYVGQNANGTSSLFRVPMGNGGVVMDAQRQEIAEGVDGLGLDYFIIGSGAYVEASAVPANSWRAVGAVRTRINLASSDRAGVDGARHQRSIAHTATIRNRVP